MPQHVDPAVLRRTDHPTRVLRLVARGHVQAGHHDIQLRQQVIVVVQTVPKDVHLHARQKPEVVSLIRQPLVDLRHHLQLSPDADLVESVRLERRP